MTIAIIALLCGLSFYLAARLHAAVAEISALRANIANLKRRIGQL